MKEKFCGECGARLDEATGLCPKCDAEKLRRWNEWLDQPKWKEPAEAPKQRESAPAGRREEKKRKSGKKETTAQKKARKREQRAQWSTGKKVRRFLLKLLGILLALAVLAAAGVCALVYFGIVDIPAINTILNRVGITEAKTAFMGQPISESYIPNEENIVYENESESYGYVNNMVLIFSYSYVSEERIYEIAENLDGKIVGKIPGIYQYQIQVEPMSKEELENVCESAIEYDEVKFAIVDTVIEVESEALYTPNDPWKDTFQGITGVDWDEDTPNGYNWWIEATKVLSAWQNRDHFSKINVGIVDNGFDTMHEDLNINVLNSEVNNAENHGTHVAGIIGATTNNGVGISGIVEQVNLYGVDCYATSKQKKDKISVSSLLAGIILCADKDCKVINMSSGIVFENATETRDIAKSSAHDAIIYLIAMLDSSDTADIADDFIVVQSAGNGDKNKNGINAQEYGGYFASITEDLVREVFDEIDKKNIRLAHKITLQNVLDSYMVVGAVDKKQKKGAWQLADFSNYGDTITVCAPGVDIFSTLVSGGIDGSYGFTGGPLGGHGSGTSQAAPMVAGITAMVWSVNPDMNAGTVKSIIEATANIPVLSRRKADSGAYYMINAAAAVEAALNYKPESSEDNQLGQFDKGNVPVDAVEFDGHYYYLFDTDSVTTWNEAKDYCESLGGYLAAITSQVENDFLYDYIYHHGYESAYFGLTDAGSEGTWSWCNGEPVSYVHWASGEPNNEGGENYGMFYWKYPDATWNDGDFGSGTQNGGKAFICEWGEYTAAQEPERTTSGERDIVLVLDVSGSMAGSPMEETKKASVKFIDTILDEDASIGIVTYDDSASMQADFSVDKAALEATVSGIYDGGSTNIEAGLAEAEAMLRTSGARKKIIVLMSDGEPNAGKEGDELIAYADSLKEKGIIIYTLGFFESLGGYKSYAQTLMEGIASDGCHYEVASADDLVFFFEDMADQINGQKYIYIRIACPVDVTVAYNGEILSSEEDRLNVRTEFGTLTFEEREDGSSADAEDRIKVLRLKEGAEYDVRINGTGRGLMDYTIGFMDENGEYSDFRRFEKVKITRKTKIDTVAAVSETSVLNIDEDGDGRYDLKLRAEENGYGEEVDNSLLIYAAIGGGALLLVVVLVLVVRGNRKKRKTER